MSGFFCQFLFIIVGTLLWFFYFFANATNLFYAVHFLSIIYPEVVFCQLSEVVNWMQLISW